MNASRFRARKTECTDDQAAGSARTPDHAADHLALSGSAHVPGAPLTDLAPTGDGRRVVSTRRSTAAHM